MDHDRDLVHLSGPPYRPPTPPSTATRATASKSRAAARAPPARRRAGPAQHEPRAARGGRSMPSIGMSSSQATSGRTSGAVRTRAQPTIASRPPAAATRSGQRLAAVRAGADVGDLVGEIAERDRRDGGDEHGGARDRRAADDEHGAGARQHAAERPSRPRGSAGCRRSRPAPSRRRWRSTPQRRAASTRASAPPSTTPATAAMAAGTVSSETASRKHGEARDVLERRAPEARLPARRTRGAQGPADAEHVRAQPQQRDDDAAAIATPARSSPRRHSHSP